MSNIKTKETEAKNAPLHAIITPNIQQFPLVSSLPRKSLSKLIISCILLCSISCLFLIYNIHINENMLSENIKPVISLCITVTFGIFCGYLTDILGYPPMLGMLISGIFLKNTFPLWIVDIPHSWTSRLWTLSLAAIISRSGLSLKLNILQRNASMIMLLGSLPVLVEACFLASLGIYIFKIPIPWSFMAAFGVSSISPGVVVPLLLNLLEIPMWSRNKLPPLMLAASGIDVLIATTGFGIALASAFKHSHEHAEGIFHDTWYIRGIEELVFGILLGIGLGMIAKILHALKTAEWIASTIIFLFSSLLMGWGKINGMTGVASCAIIISWATVSNTWNREDIDLADSRLKTTWTFFKPFLFPLIGASVSLTEIPTSMILQSVGVVSMSILVKSVTAFIVCYLGSLNFIESAFVSGTWTGKASVQAALCNTAIEMVHLRGLKGAVEEKYAVFVFTFMVASIILGGPIAGIWVGYFSKIGLGPSKHENIEAAVELKS